MSLKMQILYIDFGHNKVYTYDDLLLLPESADRPPSSTCETQIPRMFQIMKEHNYTHIMFSYSIHENAH